MSATDFAALLPDVARRLLGEPVRTENGGTTWRYGNRGSLAVHVGGARRGTFRDFEGDVSGGTLALVEHVAGCDRAGALRYLVDVGLLAPAAGPDARPAAPQRPAGTSTPAPVPRPTAAVAAAILAAAVPADATPARAYLAGRGTWPPFGTGPDLPPSVRWLPPAAWERLPTWPGPDGRPRRLTPPCDGVTRLVPGAPPPWCGAVVYELARPGCAPDAVTLDAVTAAGARPAERWRRSAGATTGRTFAVPAPSGDGWPDAVAVVEGATDALALARLRLPGVLVRAGAGTAGVRRGAALVADLPAAVAVVAVSDGDKGGRAAVVALHEALHAAGRACYAAVLRAGDLDELLRGTDGAALAAQHAERAAIYEYDDGAPRPAATARALARLLETLPRRRT